MGAIVNRVTWRSSLPPHMRRTNSEVMNKGVVSSIFRDSFFFGILCVIGLVSGLIGNQLRAQSLKLQYRTPVERHLDCGCY